MNATSFAAFDGSTQPYRMGPIQPYRIQISQKYLDLTKQKLELTRLPQKPRYQPRTAETSPCTEQMEYMLDHWCQSYDWRRQEQFYNDILPQFRVALGGTRLHFVQARSKSPTALPLLILHGWPESFLSFSKMIEPLTMDDDQSFHVVIPSLPGAGFSDPVPEAANNIQASAEVFHSLMRGLGYHRYIVHGSGWGLHIGRVLALMHPESCMALHTVDPLIPLSSSNSSDARDRHGMLRPHLHGDWPTTPGQADPTVFALCDSPSAMLACMMSELLPPPSSQVVGYLSIPTPESCQSSPGVTSPASHQSKGSSPLGQSNGDASSSLFLSNPWKPTAIIDWTMIYWLTGPETTMRWLAASAKLVQNLWTTFSEVPLGVSRFHEKRNHITGNELHLLRREEVCHWVVALPERDGVVRSAAWERPMDVVADLRNFLHLAQVQGRFTAR